MRARRLASFWNGSWGSMTSRRVWVDVREDGRYDVRWRGGDWRDRDGWLTTDEDGMLDALAQLLDSNSEWKATLTDAAD